MGKMTNNTIFKYITICLILILFISCERRYTRNESIPNDQSIKARNEYLATFESIKFDESQNVELAEFNSEYILLAWEVFEKPNINTMQLFRFFSPGMYVKILQYGDNIILNGKENHWIKIKNNNNQIGWTFYQNVKIFTGYYPMNRVDTQYLVMESIIGNNKFRIGGKYGHYFFEYGMSTVKISFFSRDKIFDDDFLFMNRYNPQTYRTMEYFVNHRIETLPWIDFTHHRRKNIKNDIRIVDAFMFTAHSIDIFFINRIIYFTTINYDIRIRIEIPDRNFDNLLFRQIIQESPQYFLLSDGAEYKGEDPREYHIIWNIHNNGLDRFAEDLINGIHPSTTFNQWFKETERLLEGLRIE